MTKKARNYKNTSLALTIALISLVIIASILTSSQLQSNSKINADTIINQISKQSSLPTNLSNINQTNGQNETSFQVNSSNPDLTTNPISSKSSTIKQPPLTPLYFSLADNMYEDQITGPDTTPISNSGEFDSVNSSNNFSSESSTSTSIPLETIQFETYTYGGYSVQQPDPTQFFFPFPDNTNQGQLAGSDALTLNAYPIQKITFDAAFITPKINALGFDEMVIFAASDTTTYKGTEFGIRMDLKDGFIYGYNQEPGSREPFSSFSEVNFRMFSLIPNDGNMHHYTMIMSGTEVTFYVDGVNYGTLSFLSNTDYSSLTFSVLAVVHRFTDDWDSVGDNMTAENFSLN